MDVLSRRGIPRGADRRRAAALTTALAGGATCALLALATAGCSGDLPRRGPLPGPGGRLNPIYDALLIYPGLEIVVGGLPYRGVEIDLEIEFRDASVRDDDPLFAAEARVVGVSAGGVPQAFEVAGPLDVEGTLDGEVLTTGLFGPLRVGNSGLLIEMEGTLADGRRRATGDAALHGFGERGTFTAVKRRRYLVAGSDATTFGKASIVTVRYDTRYAIEHDVEIVSGDPVTRVRDGRAFIVNRLTYDNLQGLDPADRFLTAFQYSTDNGSNPQDLAVIPGDPDGADPAHPGVAFVTRYEPPFDDVAIFDLADGALLDRIDLKPYALNRDRTPRADQALLHDGLLYVTLQDVDRSFRQFMGGRVAVIDPTLRDVISVIDLPCQNPFQALAALPETGIIFIGCAGIFNGLLPQALTGGIVMLDSATRQATLLVDDDALGGNVSAMTLHSPARGYCIVNDAAYRNSIVAFDPTSGEALGTIYESPSLIATLAADGDGLLVVADTSYLEPRVLLFDAATGVPVAALPALLPPVSIAILTRSL